jgi:SAM-dependent methyltransferase|tara:strand:+ start:272 stop:1477 length:1206 start_codon:yes stop_codon:yes gene_type:complete
MELIMDFGNVALAGGFLKTKEFKNEKKYPMRVCFCKECFAVQVVDIIEPDILFRDYFYFSSSIKTLSDHFVDYAKELTSRFLNPQEATVLEFGCNDGVLLYPLADQGIKKVIGVDPAKNIISSINDKRITIINNYFNEKVSREVVAKYGSVDLIMANNVFAHIPDIKGTTIAIKNALSDEGVFVFEVHYLGKIIDEMQYDMIYHEHLYYYSLLSAIEHFKKYDLTIFDIKHVPIHAGSIRFYVAKKNSNRAKVISENVRLLEKEEKLKAYNKFESFKLFSKKVEDTKKELIELLKKLKKEGKTVAGYGASGRANTIIQNCEITNDLVSYMIDDAPAKVGCYTPGSHLEILSSSVLNGDNAPDYVLVFAWSFFDEIVKRNKQFIESGGKMIVPLPEVKVISF